MHANTLLALHCTRHRCTQTHCPPCTAHGTRCTQTPCSHCTAPNTRCTQTPCSHCTAPNTRCTQTPCSPCTAPGTRCTHHTLYTLYTASTTPHTRYVTPDTIHCTHHPPHTIHCTPDGALHTCYPAPIISTAQTAHYIHRASIHCTQHTLHTPCTLHIPYTAPTIHCIHHSPYGALHTRCLIEKYEFVSTQIGRMLFRTAYHLELVCRRSMAVGVISARMSQVGIKCIDRQRPTCCLIEKMVPISRKVKCLMVSNY
jgi:hypothetical protein